MVERKTKMNKLFSRVAALSVGLAMAIGVGVAVGSSVKAVARVNAETQSVNANWTRITSLSDLNVTDTFVLATNNGNAYFNGTVNSGHFQTSEFSSSAPTNTANGTIKLESISSGVYRLKVTGASNTYAVATKAGSGGGNFASSDNSGWAFTMSSSGFFQLQYQESTKTGCFCSYNNGSFRTYASYGSNQQIRIYKYLENNNPTISLSSESISVPTGENASFTVSVANLKGNFSISGGSETYFSMTYTPSSADGDHTVTLHGNTVTTSPIVLTVSSQDATSKTISVNVIEAISYTKITSINNLKAGNVFIIGNTDGTKVLKKYASGNNCSAVNATSTDGVITNFNIGSDYAEFTLSGSAGAWVFTDQSGNKYYGTSGQNYLQASSSSTGTFSISIANDGVATITTNAQEGRTLQYNSSSTIFACYTTSQKAVSIYMVSEPQSLVTASEVETLISAIGDVEYSVACKAKIDAARALADEYNGQEGCSYEDVSNYSTLTDAETTYTNLENQALANDVISLIDAIGTVEYSAACKAKIDAARAAYDALNVTQQGLVSNYSTLTAAEAEYESLKPLMAEYIFTASTLTYTENIYGGTWTASDSSHISGFETSGSARGVQIGAAKGQGTLTLNSGSTSGFEGYVCVGVSMIVSTNNAGNTLGLSVGGSAFTVNSEETYVMPSENNFEVIFEGLASFGDVVVSYNDSAKSIYIKSISVLLNEAKEIADTRLTTSGGSISATIGADSWTVSGFVFEIKYQGESTWNVASATYVVTESVPTSYTSVGEYPVHFKVVYAGNNYHLDTPFTATVIDDATPISEFHTSLDTSKTYKYRGTVIGIEGNSYYLQQGEYGILIYGGKTTPPEGMKVGDLVQLTSKVQNYNDYVIENNGGAESATILGTGTLPAAPIVTTVAGFNAHNQSTRVTFNGLLRNDTGTSITWESTWTSKSTDAKAVVKDSTNATIKLVVSRYLDSDEAAAIIAKINTITVNDTFDLFQGVKVVSTSDGSATLSVLSADNITIHTPEEDHIQTWIDMYMQMDNPAFDGDGTGACRDSNYYVNAKAGLKALEEAHPGSIDEFQEDSEGIYADALARYKDWAKACGDAEPFDGNDSIVSHLRPIGIGIYANNPTMVIVITISAIGTLAFTMLLVFKKKKQK